jgi:hypothetical protein
MIKVFFLIFEPSVAWEKIARARRGIFFITFIHILPLLLVATAAESWGLQNHGKWQPKFQKFREFQPQEIITYETIQFVLLLTVVFISALLVFKVSQTFQDRQKFLPSFTVVAYGFSPIFLFHLLDAGATMNPATSWLIGMALTMWILYQGIPRVMQPDPTHAFGVYLSSIFVVLLTSGLERLITGMYLLGYMDFQHSWLSRKIPHLLGHNF